MITQEIAHEYFEYKDGDLYWKKSDARRCYVGEKVGWIDDEGYKKVIFKYRKESVHRIIFLMHHGYLPKEIDHKDGNPANNDIKNLREASRSQQVWNTRIRKDNKSGVKGVCWDAQRKQWLVRVCKHKKIAYQGRFNDLELAELIAIEARNKYHMEFARCQ